MESPLESENQTGYKAVVSPTFCVRNTADNIMSIVFWDHWCGSGHRSLWTLVNTTRNLYRLCTTNTKKKIPWRFHNFSWSWQSPNQRNRRGWRPLFDTAALRSSTMNRTSPKVSISCSHSWREVILMRNAVSQWRKKPYRTRKIEHGRANVLGVATNEKCRYFRTNRFRNSP